MVFVGVFLEGVLRFLRVVHERPLGGGLVSGWGGGCLPCPALLSAPVTLTLALSRRAGEGGYVHSMERF